MASYEYEQQAVEFLKRANATMTISYTRTVQGFPFDEHDHNMHDEYTIRIFRDGKSYSFKFYNSAYATMNGERPTKYDVLACVEKYPMYCRDEWEFANEFGYEIECKKDFEKVRRIFNACEKQYRKLLALFGEELMEELQKIA